MRTKQSKANREARAAGKARQVRSSALGKLLIMLAVVAAIVFGVAIFFKVNTIEIQGNTVYSADQIIEASQIQQGDNLLTVNKALAVGNIKAALPYVEDVSIARSLPDGIIIQVRESVVSFAVMTDTNAAWLIGPGGKALERIERGQKALAVLETLRQDPKNESLRAEFTSLKDDLGFGLLLKRYTDDVQNATDEMKKAAAASTIPQVAPMFWAFRLMVGCGLVMALVFVLGVFFSVKKSLAEKPWFLKLTLMALPLPWIACEAGWFVAEYGRQPWTIYNVLPTHLSVSALGAGEVLASLIGFVVLYSALLVVEMWLMIRFGRKGPSSLGTGRYHFEQK